MKRGRHVTNQDGKEVCFRSSRDGCNEPCPRAHNCITLLKRLRYFNDSEVHNTLMLRNCHEIATNLNGRCYAAMLPVLAARKLIVNVHLHRWGLAQSSGVTHRINRGNKSHVMVPDNALDCFVTRGKRNKLQPASTSSADLSWRVFLLRTCTWGGARPKKHGYLSSLVSVDSSDQYLLLTWMPSYLKVVY